MSAHWQVQLGQSAAREASAGLVSPAPKPESEFAQLVDKPGSHGRALDQTSGHLGSCLTRTHWGSHLALGPAFICEIRRLGLKFICVIPKAHCVVLSVEP